MTRSSGLSYDRYSVDGHREWLMRVGPANGMPILFVPPLLEEMNRTRALIVAAMRALAERGFACWLPDLPGTGESERGLETVDWSNWRSAIAEAGKRVSSIGTSGVLVASIRGGALLDDAAKAEAYWRFAPAEGASLARDLARSGLVSGGQSAGYPHSEQLIEELRNAKAAPLQPLRTVRLATDPRAADVKLDGAALWRRSEPGSSPELARLMATDIAEWTKTCVGS